MLFRSKAQARKFYDRCDANAKKKLEQMACEAVFQMQKRPLILAESIIGLDPDLMIKARIVAPKSDANSVWNWLHNFTPYELVSETYEKSRPLPLQDILVITDPEWTSPNPEYQEGIVIVDPYENVIFILGMRYFGERKKGTLTLAWTSGMRIGQVACHGGIKEIDFTQCRDPRYHVLGKRSVAFFGLSGSGKSSHTNSHDNAGTLPDGFKRCILHDDAFQIDLENKICRAWEPTLFDKTDCRDLEHPDWQYCISSQNNGLIEIDGKVRILAMDIRNQNGRCIFDRDMLGHSTYVNRCGFPHAICWLMKDETLPPLLKFENTDLAIAMGATLMTKRTAAENVPLEEMKKLIFEPFANPFRVYELYKDCEGFEKVILHGASCYCFNSGGFWGGASRPFVKIPLKLSLRLNTAILCDELQWEPWPMLKGALVPTAASIDPLWPDYSKTYETDHLPDREAYLELFRDRFQQRRDSLKNSDVKEKPQLWEGLLSALA